jgi:hypothetical protein
MPGDTPADVSSDAHSIAEVGFEKRRSVRGERTRGILPRLSLFLPFRLPKKERGKEEKKRKIRTHVLLFPVSFLWVLMDSRACVLCKIPFQQVHNHRLGCRETRERGQNGGRWRLMFATQKPKRVNVFFPLFSLVGFLGVPLLPHRLFSGDQELQETSGCPLLFSEPLKVGGALASEGPRVLAYS